MLNLFSISSVKYALRVLRKTPGLTSAAVLCLGVAIGLSTGAFSVVDGAFLSPLPVPGGARIVMLREQHLAGSYNVHWTPEEFTRRSQQAVSFEGMGAWYTRNITLEGAGVPPFVVRAAYVTPNTFALAGTSPALGRGPASSDVVPGADPVVLLSDAVWRSRFGADPAIVGQRLSVAGAPRTVIAVMPGRFAFPVREQIWIPLQADTLAAGATDQPLQVFARLKDGVSLETAEAELAVIGGRQQAGERPDNRTVTQVRPFTRGFMAAEELWALYAFVGGLAFFLLVTAANLANLLLARNSARLRELGIRGALGATRGRLVGQLLIEALLLGGMGGALGLLFARATVDWLVTQLDDLPWWADFSINAKVLGFAIAAAIVAAAVAGIPPALRLTRVTFNEALKQEGAGSAGLRFGRLSAALFLTQVAIAVGFLGAVGVLAEAMLGFSYSRYGLPAREVLIAQIYFGPPAREALEAPGANRREVWQAHFRKSRRDLQRLAVRAEQMTGVEGVTYASLFPGNDVESARIEIETRPAGELIQSVTRIAEIGPAFFETLGTRVIVGRDFLPPEREGDLRFVIVNEPFVRKYFPEGHGLGTRLRILPADTTERPGQWMEVVGVVPDLGMNPGDPGRADGIYVPLAPTNVARLAIRGSGEPRALVPMLYDAAAKESFGAQVQWVVTLEDQMQQSVALFRGLAGGLLLIGGVALLLSAVSFYSLVSFAVTRRTREIGIRIALGAPRRAVLSSIFGRETAKMAAGGLLGVALGIAVHRLLTLLPFDLRPAGPYLLLVLAGLILLVGVAACAVPARRLLRIQPTEALRYE